MSVIVSHVYLLNGKRLGVLEQSFLSKYQLIKHSNEKSYNYSWLYLIKRNNFMLYLYISKQIRELENTQEWVPTKESLWSFLALSCHQKAVKLPGTNPPAGHSWPGKNKCHANAARFQFPGYIIFEISAQWEKQLQNLMRYRSFRRQMP